MTGHYDRYPAADLIIIIIISSSSCSSTHPHVPPSASRHYKMATSKRTKKTVPVLAGSPLAAPHFTALNPYCTVERIAPGPGAYHPETTTDLAWRMGGGRPLTLIRKTPYLTPPQVPRTPPQAEA